MSQVIPGGRPRASSDGDILDEGFCGALFVNLSERHSEETRNNSGKTYVNINNNNGSRSCLDTSNDTFDSDGEISSQSQSSSVTSRRLNIFKSMRKVVSRAFVKESPSKLSQVGDLKRVDKLRASEISKIWTPDLRHLTEDINGKSQEAEDQQDLGTMSSARPLITDPSLAMLAPQWKKTPGTIGILNHGNSCFMNAVLQCLSNTDSFTEYFIKDLYKHEIKTKFSKNGKKGVFRTNHGEVTEQLGHLLKCLWSGKYNSDISKEFKTVVGKLNQQYKGEHQHDAQEFLLWLLDRIHEDVSVYQKKKFKSQKTVLTKTEDELAHEAASVNGDSFILKLFQAVHSSTLICTTCGEKSSTFDPYLCVSLPLPQKCPRCMYVKVVPLEPHHSQVIKYAVVLNQSDSVRDLRERISREVKISTSQIILVQMKEDGFGATYSDEQLLSDIFENEIIYAIETHSNDSSMNSSLLEYETQMAEILVTHVEVQTGSLNSYGFGAPALLRVRRDITWKELQNEILTSMGDAVYKEIFTQKLHPLFSLRIYDGSSERLYLQRDVEMPLYTQSFERAYSTLDEDFGPAHVKIIVEWDSATKKTIIKDDKEHTEIHQSVKDVQNSSQGQGKVSLEECFKLYTQEEKLTGEDAWFCPHCKQQQQGTIKTLRLWSLPDILVLHLKRFKQTGLRRSKLNTLVEFPIDNLDMSPHLSHRMIQTSPLKQDDYTYDLLGVSNHYGNMMGGHYTAFCRSPVDGQWREFNDAKVTVLDGPIATREAYLLFYQRRSLTKDINKRLHTRDHWVFSLDLSPIEPPAETDVAYKVDVAQPPKRSRSRSASPSSHKQNNKDSSVTTRRIPSRPLTPQLPRRSTEGYALLDDSRPTSPDSPKRTSQGRQSRQVQRQVSEPHIRRDLSAGASLSRQDVDRSLYGRRSNDYQPKQTPLIDRTDRSLALFGKSKPLAVNNSRVEASQIDDWVLDPDRSSYPETRPSKVKFEDKENYNTLPNYKSQFYPTSEDARKRLAQLKKPTNTLERQIPSSIDTIEEESVLVRHGSRKFESSKHSIPDYGYSSDSFLPSNGHSLSSDFNDYSDINNSYREYSPKNYISNHVVAPSSYTRPELSSNPFFRELARVHFDDLDPEDRYTTRRPIDRDKPFSYTNGVLNDYNKAATLSRVTYRSHDSMPRSNTDHSIQYLQFTQPPSPTPPQNPHEEKSYGSSAFSPPAPSFGNYPSNGLRASRSSRTLPSQSDSYNFHPPRRSLSTLKPLKPKESSKPNSFGNIPTPCLRESSV